MIDGVLMQDYPRLYWEKLQGVPSPHLEMLELHSEVTLFAKIWIYPLDTGRKLNVNEMFRAQPGRHVQFTPYVQGVNFFNIYPIYLNIS